MNDEVKTRSQPISKRQVWEAYQELRGNGKAAGIDRISLDEFEINLGKNLYKVWNRMASGSYFPPPVREVEIPKKDGGVRKLGVPTVGDRVAQMVVKRCIEPQAEPCFHEDSFGYRPNKSAHEALDKARKRCWQYAWVVDLDIKGFFDNLDHELLMLAIKKHCKEKWVLMYIERWLKAPVQRQDGSIQQRDRGTPQGGVISPLLANMYLHYAFDKWIARQYPVVKFERYADDIIVHCSSEREAVQLLEQIRKRMENCKLELHPEKTKIVYCKKAGRDESYKNVSYTFLGYTFKPRWAKNRDGKLFLGFSPAISRNAREKICADLRKMKIQCWTNRSIAEIAADLNPKVRGWLNYYGKFTRSALYWVMDRLNQRLHKWVINRYKRHNKSEAYKWLKRVFRETPNLFAHWQLGFPP